MEINTYDCTVRLGGNILHAVPKKGITEKELRLLKLIHGSDAVIEVKDLGKRTVDEFQLHMELAFEYGKERVEKAFGVSLDLFDIWKEERADKAELEREQTRIERQENEQRIATLGKGKEKAPA